MLKQLSALILFSAISFPQNVDSLNFSNKQNNSDTSVVSLSDTVAVTDTLKITEAAIKDTVIPIQGEPLTDVSTIINKRTFLFDNYRYTGDLLRSFSLNFIKDLGFVGYPSETFIYGVGNGGISYLQDGVFWNNRYTNSLDLNLIQSENIDSIEIVPSPRGFLYGPYNNPVTVNFITRDFIPPVPYARVKYYEGPDGEAMIDGKFSAMVAKRWNYSFQLTNRSKDDTYQNTDLSLWQFNTKLKYFLSNSVNLQAYYYYVDKKQGLNGGVNYDSLSRISDNPNSDLYDPIFAPVVSLNQKLNILQHNVGLRTLAKPFDDSQLDLSIYYRYGKDELSDILSQDSRINEIVEGKSAGTQLNYNQKLNFIKVDFLGTYEETKIKRDRQLSWDSSGTIKNWDKKSISGVIILSADLLNNLLIPSIYYRYSNEDFLYLNPSNKSLNGFGADMRLNIDNIFSLYGGYSQTDQLLSNSDKVETIETGVNYSGDNLLIKLNYFTRSGIFLPGRFVPPGGPEPQYFLVGNLSGLGMNLNYCFWKILLETNSSYYFNGESLYHTEGSSDYEKGILDLPELQVNAGIYLMGDFFESNLNLKTGFKFYYTGKINSSEYYYLSTVTVNPTNKLDFNLAGEIKKVFIFYFQWENLFNNLYYITPYYPMPERNIKFGLAWELFN
jgi:hypothetical protein